MLKSIFDTILMIKLFMTLF